MRFYYFRELVTEGRLKSQNDLKINLNLNLIDQKDIKKIKINLYFLMSTTLLFHIPFHRDYIKLCAGNKF